MSRVWLREAVGLTFLAAGLAAGGFCVWFLTRGYIIEGGILVPLAAAFVGAGSHLLKVALAVRVLLDSKEK